MGATHSQSVAPHESPKSVGEKGLRHANNAGVAEPYSYFSIAEVLTGVENAYNLFRLTVKNPGFQAGLLLR